MRISDWSSDGCSSDLVVEVEVFTTQLHASPDVADHHLTHEGLGRLQRLLLIKPQHVHDIDTLRLEQVEALGQIGEEPRELVGLHDGRRMSIGNDRSEEHTSELQSLMRISYAVFCL